jgi:hypothetical protein
MAMPGTDTDLLQPLASSTLTVPGYGEQGGYTLHGNNTPKSTVNVPPSLSIRSGSGICRVLRDDVMPSNEIVLDSAASTVCTSMFQGPVPCFVIRPLLNLGASRVATDLQINIHVHDVARTAVDLLSTSAMLTLTKVDRGQRMHRLLDAWAVQGNLLVVGITQREECVRVVAAVLRLEAELSPRARDDLDIFTSVLVVALCAVMHLERRRSVQDHRDVDAGVTRTTASSTRACPWSQVATDHSWIRFHSISAEGRGSSTTRQLSGFRTSASQFFPCPEWRV